MRGRRGTRWLLTAVILIGLLAAHIASLRTVWPLVKLGHPDFTSFYTAGTIVLDGNGERVYDLRLQYDKQLRLGLTTPDRWLLEYIRPPYALLIWTPLALLPYTSAFLVLFALNFALLVIAVWRLCRAYPVLEPYFPWLVLVVGASSPVTTTLLQGQDSILVLLLFALIVEALASGRERRAGVLLALLTIKFQYLLLPLLAVAVARRWRVLASFGTAMVALIALSLPVVGISGVMKYPALLLTYGGGQSASEFETIMPNVRGFAMRHWPEGAGATELGFAVAAAVAVALIARHGLRGADEVRTGLAAALGAGVLVSHHMYAHDGVVMFAACAAAVAVFLDKTRTSSARWAALGAGVLAAAAMVLDAPAQPVVFATFLWLAGVLAVAWFEDSAEQGNAPQPSV